MEANEANCSRKPPFAYKLIKATLVDYLAAMAKSLTVLRLSELPDVLLLNVVAFVDYDGIAPLLVCSKRIAAVGSSSLAEHTVFRPLAFRFVADIIISAYSMALPVGHSSWRQVYCRCKALKTVEWARAEKSDKAVLMEKKESRSTYSFLIDDERKAVYRVGGHYFFTVHELGMDGFDIEPKSTMLRPTRNWHRVRPSGVPPSPLRYFSFKCVPWHKYTSLDIPCSPLFRIGGSDASFPYSEYINVVIMMPFHDHGKGVIHTVRTAQPSTSHSDDASLILELPHSKDVGAESRGTVDKVSIDGSASPALSQLKVINTKNSTVKCDCKATRMASSSIRWRWVRPTVLGEAPPPRRSHSCTYAVGSAKHRLIIYGGGASSNGTTNLKDLWVLDTFLPGSSEGQYKTLCASPPSTSYSATIDAIQVQWSKPLLRGDIPTDGRFGHGAYFLQGRWPQAQGRSKLIVYGGMQFGGSLGLYDIVSFSTDDIDSMDLVFDVQIAAITGAAPPPNLKGHSTTYIGRKIVIIGGDQRGTKSREEVGPTEQQSQEDCRGNNVLPSKKELNKLLSLENHGEAAGDDGKLATINTSSQDASVPCLVPPPSPHGQAAVPPVSFSISGHTTGKMENHEETCPRIMKVQVLDIANFHWYTPSVLSSSAPPPTNRSGHGAELWGSTIVVTGGYDNSKAGLIDREARLVKTDAQRLLIR